MPDETPTDATATPEATAATLSPVTTSADPVLAPPPPGTSVATVTFPPTAADGQPPADPPAPVATAAPEPEPEPESAPFLAFEHVYERVGCGNHARRVTRDREPATPPEGHRFVQTYTLRFDTAAQRDAALV